VKIIVSARLCLLNSLSRSITHYVGTRTEADVTGDDVTASDDVTAGDLLPADVITGRGGRGDVSQFVLSQRRSDDHAQQRLRLLPLPLSRTFQRSSESPVCHCPQHFSGPQSPQSVIVLHSSAVSRVTSLSPESRVCHFPQRFSGPQSAQFVCRCCQQFSGPKCQFVSKRAVADEAPRLQIVDGGASSADVISDDSKRDDFTAASLEDVINQRQHDKQHHQAAGDSLTDGDAD